MTRSRSGNSLALVLAVSFVLTVLALCSLFYIRQFASRQEQNTAIEAAALVAAKDLTRVIISDPVFGYVSLVDSPPQGAGVAAPDGFGLPIRSINSILATIRLDMIIADRLGNSQMKTLAAADYKNAQLTVKALQKALTDSLLPSPQKQYIDQFGAKISIYDDAQSVYENNQIRVSGPSSLKKGSLSLALGYSTGIATLTPIPVNPGTGLDLLVSQQSSGCYIANQNVSLDQYPFYFSSLAPQSVLIAQSAFSPTNKTSISSVASAVQASASQTFGTGTQDYTVFDSACAQAGGAKDVRPAPGAMVLNFPDGCPPEFSTVQALLSNPTLNNLFCNWYVPAGDYPLGQTTLNLLQNFNYPNQYAAQNTYIRPSWYSAINTGVYMWLKRAGPLLNVQATVNALNTKFWPSGAAQTEGLMIVFTIDTSSGTISSSALSTKEIYASNSDKQLTGESGLSIEIPSQVQSYDLMTTYNCYVPGELGGLHGGEPLIDSRLSDNPVYSPSFKPAILPEPNSSWPCLGWASQYGGWAYNEWNTWRWIHPAGGDNTTPILNAQPKASVPGQIRPTYSTNGVAVEIALHRVMFQRQYIPPGMKVISTKFSSNSAAISSRQNGSDRVGES